MKILAQEPFLPAYQHTKHEQGGSLEDSAMIPSPSERCELSFPKVYAYSVDEIPVALHLKGSRPESTSIDGDRLESGVCDRTYKLVDGVWLDEEYGGDDHDGPCRQFAGEDKNEAYQRVHHENFSGKESGVKLSDKE